MSLNVVIVGAGLGGLAAAISTKLEAPTHSVLVLESAAALTEIGAGLQLTPNATRLLQRWGLGPRLEKLASSPEVFTIHRYNDGEVIGKRDGYGAEMLAKYKSQFWDIHRADLQMALYERAEALGVKFRFGALVTEHDFESPSVTLSSGERIECDLIVAADGLWSRCRSNFLGKPSRPLPTGDLAYRVILHVKDIADDSVRAFFETPRVALWAGPDCHAICYPLKANAMINLVLLVPDNLPEGVAKASGDIGEMHEIFNGWDPRLQSLLSMVSKVDKWKLMYLNEMEHWTNEKATVAFLGDACHPMLPYLAQGAGSSLEDGAALGKLLSGAKSSKDLPEVLQTYEALRKPRSSALQKTSVKQRYTNHLPNGQEQQDRDQLLKRQFEDPQPGYPFYWLDPAAQSFVYGYDVYEEIEKAGTREGVADATTGHVVRESKV